jgi:hypothetical protein
MERRNNTSRSISTPSTVNGHIGQRSARAARSTCRSRRSRRCFATPNPCSAFSCSSAPTAASCRPRTRISCSRRQRDPGPGPRPARGGTAAQARGRRNAAHLGFAVARPQAIPVAVSRFRRGHETVKFDLQTVHHDDLLRKLYERETDVAIAFQVPPAAPIGHRWLGQGELVVLYQEQDMPDAPPRVELGSCAGSRSSASPPAARSASSSPRSCSGSTWSWTRSSPPAPSTSPPLWSVRASG